MNYSVKQSSTSGNVVFLVVNTSEVLTINGDLIHNVCME